MGGKIVHATLMAGDNRLMGADVLPAQYERPKGFHVLLGVLVDQFGISWEVNCEQA